ncbi:hypothetical protein NIES2107_11390 [Nostoc carneum NIES-2107]|nr:hypothetical protein NIES2107_11390 [Nostoc carneum NIES-2107]
MLVKMLIFNSSIELKLLRSIDISFTKIHNTLLDRAIQGFEPTKDVITPAPNLQSPIH